MPMYKPGRAVKLERGYQVAREDGNTGYVPSNWQRVYWAPYIYCLFFITKYVSPGKLKYRD